MHWRLADGRLILFKVFQKCLNLLLAIVSLESSPQFKFRFSCKIGRYSNTGSPFHGKSQVSIRKEKLNKPNYAHTMLIMPVLKSSGHSRHMSTPILPGPITQGPSWAGMHATNGNLAVLHAHSKVTAFLRRPMICI